MASIQLFKNVLSGTSEYTFAGSTGSGGSLGTSDSISFVFDNDFTIDDILVAPLGDINMNFNAYIVYPSGNTQSLQDATNTVAVNAPYRLNYDEATRNMWFRIPKWSVLQFVIGEITTGGPFQISVLGRG